MFSLSNIRIVAYYFKVKRTTLVETRKYISSQFIRAYVQRKYLFHNFHRLLFTKKKEKETCGLGSHKIFHPRILYSGRKFRGQRYRSKNFLFLLSLFPFFFPPEKKGGGRGRKRRRRRKLSWHRIKALRTYKQPRLPREARTPRDPACLESWTKINERASM